MWEDRCDSGGMGWEEAECFTPPLPFARAWLRFGLCVALEQCLASGRGGPQTKLGLT